MTGSQRFSVDMLINLFLPKQAGDSYTALNWMKRSGRNKPEVIQTLVEARIRAAFGDNFQRFSLKIKTIMPGGYDSMTTKRKIEFWSFMLARYAHHIRSHITKVPSEYRRAFAPFLRAHMKYYADRRRTEQLKEIEATL